MARGFNRIFLVGNLGHDPEIKTTQAGQRVAKFSLAINDGGKDKPTLWVNIVAWDKLADIVEQYIKKGSQIHVEGRLQCREWAGKRDGEKHKAWEVVAQNILMLGGAKREQAQEHHDPGNEWPSDPGGQAEDDSDIPF